MTDDVEPSVKKSRWNSRSELMKMPREDLVDKILKQILHIEYLMTKQGETIEDLSRAKDTAERQKVQIQEGAQRECILVLRLTSKEQEVQDLLNQVLEMKQWHHPASAQIQSRFLDPAVNVVIERLKSELDDRRAKISVLQDDLLAVKFTPDSQTGKRLMAKCRGLHTENEDFGRMTSSGRIFKLEGDVALEQQLIRQLRLTERDSEACLAEFDDDAEAMQATIYAQQSQLKESQEQINQLRADNARLLATAPPGSGSRGRVSTDSTDTKKGGSNNRGYAPYGGDQSRGGASGGFGGKGREEHSSGWRSGGGRGEKFGRYDNSSSRTWDDRGGAGRDERSFRTNRGGADHRARRSSRDSGERGRDSSYKRNRSPDHYDRQNRSPDSHRVAEKRRRRDSTPDVKREPSVGDRESRDRTDIKNHDIRRKSKDASRTSEESHHRRASSPGVTNFIKDVNVRGQRLDESMISDFKNGDRMGHDTNEPASNCGEQTIVNKIDKDRMRGQKGNQPRTSPVQKGNNLSKSDVAANGIQCALNGPSSGSAGELITDASMSLKTAIR